MIAPIIPVKTRMRIQTTLSLSFLKFLFAQSTSMKIQNIVASIATATKINIMKTNAGRKNNSAVMQRKEKESF